MPAAAVLWSPGVARAHVAAIYALPFPAALFPRSRPGLAACPAEHAASPLQAEAAARCTLLLCDGAPRLGDAACSVWVGEQPSLGHPLGARGCRGAAHLPEQPAVHTCRSAPAGARLLQSGPAARTAAERSAAAAAAPAAVSPAVALTAAAAAAAAAAEAEAAAAAAADRARSDPSAARRSAAQPGSSKGRSCLWDWLGRAACGQQKHGSRCRQRLPGRLAHAVRGKQPHGSFSGRRGRGRVGRACTSWGWQAWGPRLCSRIGSGGAERLSWHRAGARQPARGA